MKRLFLYCVISLLPLSAVAQGFVVRGVVADASLRYPLMYASAAVLQKSGAVVRSSMTDSLGQFQLQIPAEGDYTLRLSYIGYRTDTEKISLRAGTDTVDIGLAILQPEENTLAAATVTATIARVQQVGDTTQFNAEAYRVPEGSTLEALVKQLPGIEVSDDGNITYNGKSIKSFLVNGKDFFKGDTKVAMKNLPTEMVNKIKAYDKKSDYAEQTGIDDGEEETVLDIVTKRELNESWVVNADLGYGTRDRYSSRLFGTRFTDKSRVTLFGSANNTGDRGFGGPRGFGGQQGLTASKMGGADFSWENGRKKKEGGKLELGGSAYYNHMSNDLLSTAATETFLTAGRSNSFGNNRNRSDSHRTNFTANAKLQWSPDSMTTITLRPSFSHEQSRNSADRYSATFNEDPYAVPGISNPLDSIFQANNAALQAIAVNRNIRYSLGNSVNNNFRANLNLVRRLSANGRNVSLRGDFGISGGHSNSYTISDILYYQESGRDAYLNQYTYTPSKNRNYSLRVGYVEPLGRDWYAEVRYEYSYRYQDSNRSLYNLHDIDSGAWADSHNYPSIGTLPTEADVLQAVRDDFNSQYATYRYYNNNVNLGIRYNSNPIRFNAGLSFNPQRTKMQYERPGQSIDTLITRRVFNLSPEMRFRYRFSRTNSLEINYRGSASQPSMTNLLDVVDDSDPLSISMGNPGLKPSWTNTLRTMYRGYNTETQAGIMGSIDFSATSNNIATRIVYDDATGVRYSRPENISGNWNLNGRFMYNFSFGPEKLFSLTTHTNAGYGQSVGYVSRMSSADYTRALLLHMYNPYKIPLSGRTSAYYNEIFNSNPAIKNKAKNLTLGERLTLIYRAAYFDIGVVGSLNYQNARNSVQTGGNLSSWLYSYGLTANTTFPWGTAISTDIHLSSRRGYADRSMNTNELLWNAQLSQSFLRGKPLTVSVQFYDILRKQSNVSRTINAQMRSDTWNNAIHSYMMVHVIYKLSIFGGKSSKGSEREEGRGWRGAYGDGPRGGGMKGAPQVRMF